ncbi:MAG: bifunctional 2-polyprenyl-6-hydroxyphenol methylase/3-demethylubiquinol 3-O-methyltransferase UbiG [Alphaproteobacteria bacterium]
MAAHQQSSIDPADVARFSAIAAEWWDAGGKFAPLHKFNPVRLGWIRDQLCSHFGLDHSAQTPFVRSDANALRVLDIGCGGGLLSEPMARMGAAVTGADASEQNINTAAVHAAEQGLAIDYRASTAEELYAAGERFDIILNMEVVEHVAHPRPFLRDCARMLKPGGIMLVATLNRTPKSLMLAKFGAEYVLRWLPRGTHDWGKFITPAELQSYLEFSGLEVVDQTGVSYAPFADQFSLNRRDMGVNYMMTAVNPDPA